MTTEETKVEETLPRVAAIVDVETTGLDPGKHVVIEAAVVLYDLEALTVLTSYSTLVHQRDAVTHGNPARKWNGIDPAWLRGMPSQESAWPRVKDVLARAELVLAHRAVFDRGFFPRELRELRPWSCTKFGVRWPHGPYGGHLVELVRAHELAYLGREEAEQEHRALGDCLLLARLLELTSRYEPTFAPRRLLWEARGRTEPDPALGEYVSRGAEP